ncbi:MAG: proline racemase family protein [Cytophagales bacterium]|nr:proline racemase family protein [Cytophagales bacterium]
MTSQPVIGLSEFFFTGITFEPMYNADSYSIPGGWIQIKTIEMHTAGEPLRVILDGFPEIQGTRVLDYRRFIQEHYDHLRTALMFEPRGHADMYGVIVTPSQVADFGVVFIHNEGYSTMCGHATLAIAKLAVEAGWVETVTPVTKITIEAPCGILTAFVHVDAGKVTQVRFLNVPSFVAAMDQSISLPKFGTIRYDLAYGGAFYAFVDAQQFNLKLNSDHYQELIDLGMQIKRAVASAQTIAHPEEADLSFLYGTIFIDRPESTDAHSRNVCIFAEGEVDRSPTGSGVSARIAIHHARGEVALNEAIPIESILGTTFDCKVAEVVDYHGINAVIPEVAGDAYVTGKNIFTIDPNDPLKDGFIFR